MKRKRCASSESNALSKTHPNRYDFKEKLKEVQPIYTFNTTATNLWIYMHSVPLIYQHAGYIHRKHHQRPDTHIPSHHCRCFCWWTHVFESSTSSSSAYELYHTYYAASPRMQCYWVVWEELHQLSTPQFMLNSPQKYVAPSIKTNKIHFLYRHCLLCWSNFMSVISFLFSKCLHEYDKVKRLF